MSDAAQQKILIIDDETDVHYSFERLLAKEPVSIVTAANGEEGLRVLKKENPDVVVMDIRMGKESGLDVLREIRKAKPQQIVIMMTAYGTSQTAIEAMKLGAYDYTLKPFEIPQLKDLLKRALRAAQELNSENVLAISGNPDANNGIIGSSGAMQQIYKLIGQVAPTDATVLVTGESGTGKELVAHAIHANSKRGNALFMAINCAAIPENLLESELFGHEKGSFTGAMAQRIGRFEQCDGGTLFLDEIGEMPLAVQSKLLRILQDGELLRVGGSKPIKVSVRIIAATNRDLREAARKKIFREDLFYRLNVFSINLPPLRMRLGDVNGLVTFFMNKWRKRNSGGPTKISEDALKILTTYPWPGNVRELENCIQRAAVLANGDTITPKDLPPEIAGSGPAENGTSSETSSPGNVSLADACRVITEAASRDESVLKQLGLTKTVLVKLENFINS
ncbi:MAG: sigma-54 dependent transcriptional regulator [Verrucomicrobiales bacterium]|jgi:two-component system nitrogen regulation response regulator GlnG|nr:sigma-54 dependent transcriptional regulator [Verrucomicrobiales bacterium]